MVAALHAHHLRPADPACADAQLSGVAGSLSRRYPKAAALFVDAPGDLLVFATFPGCTGGWSGPPNGSRC